MLSPWLAAILVVCSCLSTQPAAIATSSSHVAGPLADTWYSHGLTWTQPAGPHPALRYAASLAYDAARKNFVLFGGQSGGASYDDTWTFDGRAWTEARPAHKPEPRRDAAMAYDPSLRRVVLYGGLVQDSNEGTEAADTWTWDGTDWTLVSNDNKGPRWRYGARMVTAHDTVILFGGHIGNIKYFADAWTLTGSTWVRVDHGVAPTGRADAAVAWDEDDSSLLVYGGLTIRPDAGPGNLGVPVSDAWALKAGTWSQLTSTGPPALFNANGVWDAGRHSVVVILGINCPEPVSDAWAWNGSAWAHWKLPIPARWAAATAVDTKGNILVFGGDDEVGC